MSGNSLPSIVIVEVDETNIELLQGMLEEEFEVQVISPKECNLENLQVCNPAAVILNPQGEAINIGQICTILKEQNPKAYILYLDDEENIDRQVDAYDVGCNDYLAKPFNPIEIYHKIKSSIAAASQTIEYMNQANQARNMAFTMMEANSELGTILRFIEQVITTNNYQDLGNALVNAGDSFDTHLAVQLRTHAGASNFRCQKDSDVVKLLSAATLDGKIIENGRRLIFSKTHVAFFATKIPSDPEKYGRLKDNLALLLNAAEAKMTSLIAERTQVEEREALIQDVMEKVLNSMTTIGSHYENHETDMQVTAQEFRDHMESILMAIDLDEKQEEALLKSIESFLTRLLDTEETKSLIQHSFKSLLIDLKKIR